MRVLIGSMGNECFWVGKKKIKEPNNAIGEATNVIEIETFQDR